jgi:hypothetical protein
VSPKRGSDLLFDIWCIAKIAYELITRSELLSKSKLEGISTIDELFG